MILLGLMLAAASAAHDVRCDSDQTNDLINCAAVISRAADDQLDVQWRTTVAKVQEWEKAIGPIPPDILAANGNLTYSQSLLASERAWLAYRDAECGLEVWGNAGGRELPIYRESCLTQLTKARTQQLKDFAEAH